MRFFALSLVVCAVLLEGCGCETEYYSVTEQAKQWVPYAQDDYISFETRSGQATDSLQVLSYEIENRLEEGTKDECDRYTELIRISLSSKNAFDDTIRFNLTNFHVAVRNDNSTHEYAPINLTYQDRDGVRGWITLGKGIGNEYESLTIDGKIYQDVITAGCEDCGLLTEIVMRRHHGIVAYKVNGVYWTKVQAS
jgi:hypothetical protein